MTQGEVEVAVPFTEAEYQSNAEYWRTTQSGSSFNASVAQSEAILAANKQLAAMIHVQIKSVVESYTKNIQTTNSNEVAKVYEEMIRGIVNQALEGSHTYAQKAFRLADGTYRYHVCQQVSKASLREELTDRLSEEEHMQLEFDKERFRKIFDEEMQAQNK